MNDQDYRTLHAMDRYGGGFVQALATLARHADSENIKKIKAAWPDYWARYQEIGDRLYKESMTE